MPSPCGASLHGRALVDALATRFAPPEAEELAAEVLTLTGPPPSDRPDALPEYVRGPLRSALEETIGTDMAEEVVVAAEALVAAFGPDPIVSMPHADRGPFVLLSDRPSAFERTLGIRRVTSPFDLLDEAGEIGTVVIDARAGLVAPATLAAVLEELPIRVQLVVVGATESYRNDVLFLARRPVTFTDVYEPIGLVRRSTAAVRRVA